MGSEVRDKFCLWTVTAWSVEMMGWGVEMKNKQVGRKVQTSLLHPLKGFMESVVDTWIKFESNNGQSTLFHFQGLKILVREKSDSTPSTITQL